MPPVKSKPLYRSVTFWSGILVMGFICWAWRDSLRNHSMIKGGNCEAGNTAGHAWFWFTSRNLGWSISREPIRPGTHWAEKAPLRPMLMRRTGTIALNEHDARYRQAQGFEAKTQVVLNFEGNTRGVWVLFIPHWLLLLAVTLPWTGLLIFRARHIRRATAASSP